VEVPDVQYAKSGDVNIAYQVTGEGPFDLVFVPGYVTHLELQWALPSFAPFLERLSSFSRLIRFDKRGTGMSDRVSDAPTLETRMDDVRAWGQTDDTGQLVDTYTRSKFADTRRKAQKFGARGTTVKAYKPRL
jgi:pimeloyl-ACP methyl ester carboxylesterase